MKIISYCLWGEAQKYIVGMKRNIELAAEIYPGWQVNIALGKNSSHLYEPLRKTADSLNVKLAVDQYPREDWSLMLDRFWPITDPACEVIISRDSDSRLTLREKACVDEWLDSSYGVHSISDHPHHSLSIMGGLCGFKQGSLPSNFATMLNDWQRNTEAKWQQDQLFLNGPLLPMISNNLLRHDNFYANKFGGKPMPTVRNGYEFCGATINADESYVSEQIDMLRRCL
jgi:hypothetical protein